MVHYNNMPEPDSLKELFRMQEELAHIMPTERYPKDTSGQVSALCTAAIHELIELQRLTNWKWWKKPSELDVQLAREECIDVWHFLIQLSITLDMKPDDIIHEYRKKNRINHKRQEEGY